MKNERTKKLSEENARVSLLASGVLALLIAGVVTAADVPAADSEPLTFRAVEVPDETQPAPTTAPSVAPYADFTLPVPPVSTPGPQKTSGAIVEAQPTPQPPKAPSITGTPSVQAAKRYALGRIGATQFRCLDRLFTRESHWNPRATNHSSGAYGIPQALPGSKMKSAGSDWRTNPITQVKWGLGYVTHRYGSACGAWAHSQRTGWY